MLTRKLGKSDIEVSALGLGCWAIGAVGLPGDQHGEEGKGVALACTMTLNAVLAVRPYTLTGMAQSAGCVLLDRPVLTTRAEEPAGTVFTMLLLDDPWVPAAMI